jgi:hypothetical protein
VIIRVDRVSEIVDMEQQREKPGLSLPGQREYEYGLKQAFEMAAATVGLIQDIEAQCRRAGASLRTENGAKKAVLRYLDRPCEVALQPVGVSYQDNTDELPLRDKILILHYLVTARGTPPADRYIAFKEFPEGPVYFPSFYNRAIKPWVARFGREPARLVAAAATLGGKRLEDTGTRVVIPAFDRVPVTLVLWSGDDEFPPEGNMLFDATIPDSLSTEDITVLCETIAWRLVRGAPEGGAHGR